MMTNKSNNSPSKVLSRLIHNDYFEYFSEKMMEDWNDVIITHKLKCNHLKCKDFICPHPNLPESELSPIENYYLKCPDCQYDVEMCWHCNGIIDEELFNDQGFVTRLCQNMDVSREGCEGVDMENFHVDKDSAQWVPNEY